MSKAQRGKLERLRAMDDLKMSDVEYTDKLRLEQLEREEAYKKIDEILDKG